ncbi:hypothetical protein MTO96_039701 [Rhipicephalus appendiculatus]
MQKSSEFLHQATHGSLHIKKVIIEIPSTWPPRPNATVRQGSGFERSDIRVSASSDPRVDHRPFTLQPRPCGQPGDYIHLPSEFLQELDGHTTKEYGNPSYVFVHEWAHLRYGVFDEYGMPGSDKNPELYCDSDGNVKPNVCSEKIAFKVKSASQVDCSVCEDNAVPKDCTVEFYQPTDELVESSIMFMPYLKNVSEFCVGNSGDKNRHNVLAPNKQNDLCRGKSAWEVISSNDDFMGLPLADPGRSFNVYFEEVQQSNDVVPSVVYVLDVSGSMALKRANISSEGATVMLMSDGEENELSSIEDILGNLTVAGVVVNTLAVGPFADHKMEKLALDTRGESFSVKDPQGTHFSGVDAIFVQSTTAQLDESEKAVMVRTLITLIFTCVSSCGYVGCSK